MRTTLNIIQIVLSVCLVLAVLLQVKGGSGLGGIFGGSGEAVFRTRRGIEKWLFWATIIITGLFVIVAIASLIIG